MVFIFYALVRQRSLYTKRLNKRKKISIVQPQSNEQQHDSRKTTES